MVDAVCHTI